ncbi:PAS domain-containing methyl-accepting chemotaxis protein [Pseudoalteromonas sp. OOF1S-7]|uniref:methyl-accepting chemotaxis protein n=1 Tax=Pseudoalteromonas sp. OOF1S-7 TaxID=2917757 RepID=UPI001EF4DC21|nr:PAS domain-containing methyl-accepting chemotaxis protein [Pseudoalteromonas sp. OOF1S-7]MCG7537693.1 methyl-accepting chemotaxis protein [Pseudoalteromonas sp. OOF1S-7]
MAKRCTDYTDKENDYPVSYNLLSTTDTKGRITYANQSFCDVAGFELGELEGQPHNLVRHPTMPKAAFKDLWQFIGSGKPWMGIVKNRCKNGDHYWVNAYVTPIKDQQGQTAEYQSVRTKPERDVVQRAENIYQQLDKGVDPTKLTRSSMSLSVQMMLILVVSYILSMVFTSLPAPWNYILETLLLAGILALTYQRLSPVRRLSEKAKQVYDNPLMQKIYLNKVNDVAAIELALLARGSELRAVLGRVQDASQLVDQHAQATVSECHSNTELLQEQQSQTASLATAMNEMTAAIADIASNTSDAANRSEGALRSVLDSNSVVQASMQTNRTLCEELSRTQRDIAQLNEQTVHIGGVVDVIRDISEQTNLLALNAAIEAARAGEQGRGFAVVADEVRALAQRTQDSTREIDDIVAGLKQRAERAVEAIQNGVDKSTQCVVQAEQTKENLASIEHMVKDISALNYEIATATDQMSGASNEINDKAVSISGLANASMQSADNTTAAMRNTEQALADQAALVDQFLLRLSR